MYRLEFTLCGLPKTTNRSIGKHFRAYMKERDAWRAGVNAAISGRLPPKPLKRARLTLTRYSSVEPDFDGLVSSFKAVTDALRGRVIDDDRPSCIGSPIFRWERAKPKCGRIGVVVEEIE